MLKEDKNYSRVPLDQMVNDTEEQKIGHVKIELAEEENPYAESEKDNSDDNDASPESLIIDSPSGGLRKLSEERGLFSSDDATQDIENNRKSLFCFSMRGFNLHQKEAIPENEYSGYREGWKSVYELIVESSTLHGQLFDVILLILISLSVIAAVLDSVSSIRVEYGDFLLLMEVFFTFIFTIECALRLLCVRYPQEYIFSMTGIIDATSILPTYLATFIPTARPLVHLAVLRSLRVLRVFRVLKLVRFVDEAAALREQIHTNRRRIAVFLFSVFTLILVIGCTMYLIEGERHGFSSIPISLYWTVVTLTTVGYGDIAPETVFGRVLATAVMLSGYGIIACPLVLAVPDSSQSHATMISPCFRCFRRVHLVDSNFCCSCGAALRRPTRRRKLKKVGKKEDLTAIEPALAASSNSSRLTSL